MKATAWSADRRGMSSTKCLDSSGVWYQRCRGGQVCFDQRTDGRWGVDTLPFVFVAGHEDKHYGADTLLAIVSAA